MENIKMQERSFTVEDIMNLPEGVHKEMLDGVVYDMAAPNPRHQSIVGYLYRKIADYIDRKNGKCQVFFSPFGVFLTKDDDNYVEPDISVICDKEKISERGCEGAPDWIVEVVSPSTKSMDYLRKLYHYKQEGVRLYWIVDPASEMISVYDFENELMEQYGFKDTIPVSIYDDLEIDMSEL